MSSAVEATEARAGTLEELDGTPIRTLERPRHATSWVAAARAAAVLALGRPRLWAFALVAFLARGGIAVLAAPIIVFPTLIGVSNIVGPTSVTAAGPTPRLVAFVAETCAVVLAAVVGGTLLAAAAETELHRSGTSPHPGRGDEVPGAGPAGLFDVGPGASLGRGFLRVVAIRLVLVVPVAAAVAAGVPAWVAAAYRELTLPSDVAVPLVTRVLADAPLATGLVVVAWLACEVGGGFAARRAVLLDTPVPRALAAGLADCVRAPGWTALAILVAAIPSVALLAPATLAIGAAWEAARQALVANAGAGAALGSALLLAGAWLAALVLAGIVAAWRATLMSAELLRRRPARHRAAPSPVA